VDPRTRDIDVFRVRNYSALDVELAKGPRFRVLLVTFYLSFILGNLLLDNSHPSLFRLVILRVLTHILDDSRDLGRVNAFKTCFRLKEKAICHLLLLLLHYLLVDLLNWVHRT